MLRAQAERREHKAVLVRDERVRLVDHHAGEAVRRELLEELGVMRRPARELVDPGDQHGRRVRDLDLVDARVPPQARMQLQQPRVAAPAGSASGAAPARPGGNTPTPAPAVRGSARSRSRGCGVCRCPCRRRGGRRSRRPRRASCRRRWAATESAPCRCRRAAAGAAGRRPRAESRAAAAAARPVSTSSSSGSVRARRPASTGGRPASFAECFRPAAALVPVLAHDFGAGAVLRHVAVQSSARACRAPRCRLARASASVPAACCAGSPSAARGSLRGRRAAGARGGRAVSVTGFGGAPGASSPSALSEARTVSSRSAKRRPSPVSRNAVHSSRGNPVEDGFDGFAVSESPSRTNCDRGGRCSQQLWSRMTIASIRTAASAYARRRRGHVTAGQITVKVMRGGRELKEIERPLHLVCSRRAAAVCRSRGR